MAWMRTIAPLLLVFVVFTSAAPGAGLHEWTLLGAIVQHYDHHVRDHGEATLSFFDFLVDHFARPTHADPQHPSLPVHDSYASSVLYSITCEAIEQPAPTVHIVDAPIVPRAPNAPPTPPTVSIFQPPRA
jgi:hypothetical protein